MTDTDKSFDRWALTYDEDMRKADGSGDWIFTGYYAVLDKVVEYCELDGYENPSVLDIGAGTGNLTGKLLEKDLTVSALDPSEKMREICKLKYPDIDVLKGDFLDIPLPLQSIDIIVSSYAFHHLTPGEKETSVSLMKKLLKSEGRIVIADLMFRNSPEKQRIRQSLMNSGRTSIVEDIDEEYPAFFEDIEKVFLREGFSFRGEQLTDSVWIAGAVLYSS